MKSNSTTHNSKADMVDSSMEWYTDMPFFFLLLLLLFIYSFHGCYQFISGSIPEVTIHTHITLLLFSKEIFGLAFSKIAT